MPMDCTEIIPNRLWLGRMIRPEDVELLVQMGITQVVNLQSDEDLSCYEIPLSKLIEACHEAHIELNRIEIQDFDREALALKLLRAVRGVSSALEPQQAKIYCHCTAGINRSPTIVAGYLMQSRGISAKEACAYLTARRHCSPDLTLLEEFSESLKAGS